MNFAGQSVDISHRGAGCVAFPPTLENFTAGIGTTAISGYNAFGPANEGPSGRWRSPSIVTLSIPGLYLKPLSTLTDVPAAPLDVESSTNVMKKSAFVKVSVVSIKVDTPALPASVAKPAV